MKDFVGQEIREGDYLVVGTRQGNSGGMYGATVVTIEMRREKDYYWDAEGRRYIHEVQDVPYVTFKLESNGRKQTQRLREIAGRCAVVKPVVTTEAV